MDSGIPIVGQGSKAHMPHLPRTKSGIPRLPPHQTPSKARARQRMICSSAPPSSAGAQLSDPSAAPDELLLISDPFPAAHEGPHSNGNGISAAPGLEMLNRIQSGADATTSAWDVEEVVELSKVEELLASGKKALTLEEILATFKFPLDGFQRESVEEFLKGNSVVVCAPTGAGKTAIAEAATIAVLARGQRVIYTTPLKALSNQKLQEMRTQFGFDRVGLQTGDGSLNAEGDIVVMTTEVLRNILFRIATEDEAGTAEGGRMSDVGLVVLDEVHYLGDEERGSVWEEVIISCPRDVPLLCMSATVRNPSDLGGWISKVHGECKTIITDFRPIPLHWSYCYSGKRDVNMVPLLKGAGKLNPELQRNVYSEPESAKSAARKQRGRAKSSEYMLFDILDAKVPATEETLDELHRRELLPCIWFLFSRVGCDSCVMRMHTQGVVLVDSEEQAAIKEAVDALMADQPEAAREEMIPALLNGLASHHAGCLPAWKTLIEDLYKKGLIKVVFATGTLAAGINMPARSTVISSLSRRIPNGSIPLKHNDLLQMAGRAGRRGYDLEGHCIVLQSRFDEPERVLDLLQQGPEPLQSHFATGYGMVLKVLHQRSLASARAFVERSFYNYLAAEGMATRRKQVADKVESAKFLISQADTMEARKPTEEGDSFQTYLQQKKVFQSARKKYNQALNASAIQRGAVANDVTGKMALPVLVGLDLLCADMDPDFLMPAVMVANKRTGLKLLDANTHLCLTADNKLVQIQGKHIAATGRQIRSRLLSTAQCQLVIESANKITKWEGNKSGARVAPGSGLTASLAARVSQPQFQPIELLPQHRKVLDDAKSAMESARETAEELKAEANRSQADRPDLQLRAKATRLRREAREIQTFLDTQTLSNVNWLSFEKTVNVLVKAGALGAEDLQPTPLGQVAREINTRNELWVAMVLTHSAVQDLTPAELAAVLSSIISGETPPRPSTSASYSSSSTVLQVFEAMEPEREWLYRLQMDAEMDITLGIDLRLAGIVEAWTAGATWSQVTSDCTLDGGDLARLLSRTVDTLRQVTHCAALLPPMREAAQLAVKSMARKPITDLIQ